MAESGTHPTSGDRRSSNSSNIQQHARQRMSLEALSSPTPPVAQKVSDKVRGILPELLLTDKKDSARLQLRRI